MAASVCCFKSFMRGRRAKNCVSFTVFVTRCVLELGGVSLVLYIHKYYATGFHWNLLLIASCSTLVWVKLLASNLVFKLSFIKLRKYYQFSSS
jgi:hypothetical protein